VTDVRARIHDFVLSRYLSGEPPESLRDRTPLQTSGILDSLATLTLAQYVEEEFGVVLDVYDLSAERFDRIDDIVATIARKQGRRMAPA
jgi:acyl carrier protein